MNILVTGAAGTLGKLTVNLLRNRGWNVMATDLKPEESVIPADLCEFANCRNLMESVDAVVHLGNLSHQAMAEPSDGYRRNTTCNFNVFRAAVEAEVSRIIFASSIQVYGMDAVCGKELPQLPAYFPIDDDTPLRPRNWYGLSKVAGEEALAYFANWNPTLQAVALRLPHLVDFESPEKRDVFLERYPAEIWRILSWADAARLIEACLLAELPGYRAYLPAYPGTVLGMSPRQVVQEYFPTVPLRCAIEELQTLIDIEPITRETGWIPYKSTA